MKRTFIAVKINLQTQNIERINKLKIQLKDSLINWVNTDSLHLTLFFLGDTSENQIPELRRELALILKESNPFTFKLSGLGIFKNNHLPRVIWIGVENSDSLKKVKTYIDKVLIKFGFTPDKSLFKPHLTLGRIKNLKQLNLFNELIADYENYYFQEVYVDEIIFYESTLTPHGPIYKAIDTFKLN